MSIRITTLSEQKQTVLKIDGCLESRGMDALMTIIERLERPVVLDLTDLQTVDRTVVAQFRGLIDAGLELRAASPYVELLLNPGSAPEPTCPICEDPT
jgi:anti-anti-sigma regulatory factor